MTSNLYLISLSKIVLIWLIMYLLIVIINYRNKQDKKKYNIKEIKNDKVLAQIYLDQFYITNKVYTFFITFLYIFNMVLIFIIIRYLSIDSLVLLTPQKSLYNVFLLLITIYVLIYITIILYRSLLIILCKKEINKFYLYILQYNYIHQVKNILRFRFIEHILGHLYLLTYRIATLTYKYPPFVNNLNPTVDDYHQAKIDYLMDNESEYIIENKKIIEYIYIIMQFSHKYVIIRNSFRLLAYMFGYLFKHIHNLFQLFPYFILVCVFLIDLYNKEFHNIYLFLFIYIIIITKRDLIQYLENRDGSVDFKLSLYFYKNEIDYNKQRIYFYSKDNISLIKLFYSKENKSLFINLTNLIEYIYTKDFVKTYEHFHGLETKQWKRRDEGMYRRFWIILGFSFISLYILMLNYSLLVLLFPIIFMIYTHAKTYHALEFYEGLVEQKHAYSKKHNIIFWIFTILQGYIFWLLLLKPELIFMNTEVLLELPFYLGEYMRIYSINEKIIYLYNYFEFYLSLINDEFMDKDYLRHLVRQINFQQYIDDTIKLKDIQVYIKLLVDNYYINEYIQGMLKEHITNVDKSVNHWYDMIYNTLFIGAVTLTLMYYNSVWLIMKQITNPRSIHQIVKDIYLGTIKNKLTYDILTNIIMKIFKW